MKKLIITAYITVKEDKIEGFKNMFKTVQEESRKENGCISYTLYQDSNVPAKFMVFEEWKNQGSIDAHNNSAHFKEFGNKVGEFVIADGVLITIREVSAER